MQSSPPVRAHERPSSPAESEYSIDLAALDLGSHSGASTPIPQQHIDRVLSEDIDGPSDFTQNLEAWMRGGTIKKHNTLKNGLGSVKESQHEDAPRTIAQHHTQTAIVEKEPDLIEDEHSASHHTPSDSPPRESVFETTSTRDEEEAEDVTSDWDPYAEAATPRPPSQNQFLQPTVEDYHSEFTPGRAQSTNKPQATLSNSMTPRIAEKLPNENEPSSPGRPSSDTISPVRSPVLQRSVPRQFSSQTDEAAFERQMEELRAKCQQLEHLNAALSQAVDEERRLRKEANEAHERQRIDAARRERDLTEMKDQAHSHKEDFRREFAELKERLRLRDVQQEESRRELERLKAEHAADKSEHSQAVRNLQQDLERARRGRDDAEESARAARDELEEYQNGHGDELDRMRLHLQNDDDLRDTISGLEARLQSANAEIQTLKTETSDAQATQAEIDGLRNDLEAQQSRLNDAILERDDLQDQLTSAEESHRDSMATSKAEIEDLEVVNKALDSRVSDAIRRRETYWRGRLEQVDREKEVMKKALMRQWGREEVGIDVGVPGIVRDGRQGFAYLFERKAKAGA